MTTLNARLLSKTFSWNHHIISKIIEGIYYLTQERRGFYKYKEECGQLYVLGTYDFLSNLWSIGCPKNLRITMRRLQEVGLLISRKNNDLKKPNFKAKGFHNESNYKYWRIDLIRLNECLEKGTEFAKKLWQKSKELYLKAAELYKQTKEITNKMKTIFKSSASRIMNYYQRDHSHLFKQEVQEHPRELPKMRPPMFHQKMKTNILQNLDSLEELSAQEKQQWKKLGNIHYPTLSHAKRFPLKRYELKDPAWNNIKFIGNPPPAGWVLILSDDEESRAFITMYAKYVATADIQMGIEDDKM